MEKDPQSLFGTLAESLPGTENAFTALLVTTIRFVPKLGEELLSWLREEVRNRGGLWPKLPIDGATFEGQVRPETDTGESITVDMVARWSNGDQIWFEHKIGARESSFRRKNGPKERQISRYFRLASRTAQERKCKVYLAYCTRGTAPIANSDNMERPSAEEPVALLNPSSAPFRWRLLHKRLVRVYGQPSHQTTRGPGWDWLINDLLLYWQMPRMQHVDKVPSWFSRSGDSAEDTQSRVEWWRGAWEDVAQRVQKETELQLRTCDKGGFDVNILVSDDPLLEFITLRKWRPNRGPQKSQSDQLPEMIVRCEFFVNEQGGRRIRDATDADGDLNKQWLPLPGSNVREGEWVGRQFAVPIHGWTEGPDPDDQAVDLLAEPVIALTRWILAILRAESSPG